MLIHRAKRAVVFDTAKVEASLARVEASLSAAMAEIGASPGISGDRDWWVRRRAVMAQLAITLASDPTVIVKDDGNGCRVRIDRIAATSTSGLEGALRNWISAARRKLSGAV